MARRACGTSGLVPTLLADKVCGLVLTYSIIAALFHRERTGKGQHVEVPMTDAMPAFLLVEHGSAAISRPPRGPAGYQRVLTPLRGALRTADGWIAVQPHSDADWAALLRTAGLDDLAEDPRPAGVLSSEPEAGGKLSSGPAAEGTTAPPG